MSSRPVTTAAASRGTAGRALCGKMARDPRDPDRWEVPIASSNLTVCYGKWTFIVDLPIKNGGFP